MQTPTRILLVMPPDQAQAVAHGSPAGESFYCFASSAAEGHEYLQAPTDADVAVVALRLQDGNWRSIYRDLTNLSADTELIVALPSEEDDPQTLLDFGAADVIRPPYDSAEAQAVIHAAAARVRRHTN